MLEAKSQTKLFGYSIIWLFFLCFSLYLQFFANIKPAFAGLSHNLYGWAWNYNIGWMSLNASNTPTATVDYGVNIKDDGYIDGFAYLGLAGYVKFATVNSPTTNPDNPQGPAKYDALNKRLEGWALICSMADNPATCTSNPTGTGWISLKGADYGVTVDSANILHGHAWSAQLDYISFNCDQGGVGQTNICATSDYKVARVTNFNGWVWNDLYGWISFNCIDTAPYGGGCHNFYGVNTDIINKHMAGNAWSSNLGWISFQDHGAPDYTFNNATHGNCATCTDENGCTACYNVTDRKFHGWAKILSLGDNGWISLNASDTPSAIYYNVSLNPEINKVYGWAWNNNQDNTGIGWISFSCTDGGPAREDICGISDYGIDAHINSRPTARTLTAPNWAPVDACSTRRANAAELKWDFYDFDAGATQSAHRCVIDTDDNIGNGTVYDSEKTILASEDTVRSCMVPSVLIPITLNYDTHYFFWIQVWDEYNMSSALIPYNSPTDTDHDDGQPNTFWTYEHEFPRPDYQYSPISPSVGEEVKFDSQIRAKYYTTASPSMEVDCTDDACDWKWATSSPVAPFTSIASTTASTTMFIFNQSQAAETIYLNVKDGEGYACTSSPLIIRANRKLPAWKETGGQ